MVLRMVITIRRSSTGSEPLSFVSRTWVVLSIPESVSIRWGARKLRGRFEDVVSRSEKKKKALIGHVASGVIVAPYGRVSKKQKKDGLLYYSTECHCLSSYPILCPREQPPGGTPSSSYLALIFPPQVIP